MKEECKMKKNYLSAIYDNLNLLTIDQLQLLSEVYRQLNCHCNFFMSEESHVKFIQSYYKYPSIRNPEIFKSFLIKSIKESVFETRYPTILKTIDLINQNQTFENITNILLS